ncbi:DExH-box ATP-dependent RNA helicase DExH8 [Andrographis paniculata]|uniref:DExH-box ATP-dependent RNA helicase DExH8 n=1 Tax=Andrographis paniculata TaxID=175694 RepID=UPI0021E97596|nr:DExH-box ATP-dependent RNA helicase DExH8 [Andrographis paniculata]
MASRRSSSSSSVPAPAPTFSVLPVTAMRNKIIEKILENRVTLVIGETGCGKSSQIPQFLLEENLKPILCTQPRRFAVVAVARMVAAARNCEVGDEVGYHIGHSRVFSARSKIVFKTAGVLLDEMREKGMNALKYKVIILDEVHERSVESDLVLVCIKQFLLQKRDLRVVLMSATADILRYREYFNDLGRGERVEVLAIPITGKETLFQKNVLYLEQVIDLLGLNCDNPSLEYCSGPNPEAAEAVFKPEVHKVIHELVLHIHNNEPDIEKSILVFLPTYYTLEQQWVLLKPFSESFEVHILHRSIDTEQALKAMKISKSHRKVILATNIAESSVTIPQVGYVIDSCRSLQIFWDANRKTDSAELVWVSKSQAEQRRGRTGRTCDGFVYRLVTRSFYGHLEDYESPAILKLSLRKQVLLLCCAESKAINDPKALLRKTMDPPDRNVVKDAINLLVSMNALEQTSIRGRHEPTFYGRLLSSFSLSFDASVLLLKFGDLGMLREGIILGILFDLQPLPILRPFGQDNLYLEYTNAYCSWDNNLGLGRKEVLYMSNFSSFQFWQRAFKDKGRLQQLENIIKYDGIQDNTFLLPEIEEEWCCSHHLVLPALQQVIETYDEILSVMHRFRPKSLVMSNAAPIRYAPSSFLHICFLTCVKGEEAVTCGALPYVHLNDFRTNEVAKNLASIVKQMRSQITEAMPRQENISLIDYRNQAAESVEMCRYFVSGFCKRGSECFFSHSTEAKRPVCKFFFSLQGCRNGASCVFSHDSDSLPLSDNGSSLSLPEDQVPNAQSLLRLFPSDASQGCVLILDDHDLHFSKYLHQKCDRTCIVSTVSAADVAIDPALTNVKVLSGLSHPDQTIMSREENAVPWNDVRCILWFPRFGSEYEEQHCLLKTTFSYLAIRMMVDVTQTSRLILTMTNTRFSQLQVEKIASQSFFSLASSFPFDELSFGPLLDEVSVRNPMLVSKPICYVFQLLPPKFPEVAEAKKSFRQYLHPL